MARYFVSAQIKTNIAPDNLYYEMELYKTDWEGNKTYALKPTKQQPFQEGNRTMSHQSTDVTDPEETCYILAINIYRKVGAKIIKLNNEPMTAITPLKGFIIKSDDWGPSREFEYYETVESTRQDQQGQVNVFKLSITSKPRTFEAKQHPVGDREDPFTWKCVNEQIKQRLTRPVPIPIELTAEIVNSLPPKIFAEQRDYLWPCYFPNQDKSMLCGPAAFFYCLMVTRGDLYRQIIKELWEGGKTKIGSLRIKPSNGTKHPEKFFYCDYPDEDKNDIRTAVPVIDWMTLASLKDTESVLSIDKPRSLLIDFTNITIAGTLEKWFHKVGSQTVFDNIIYRRHSNLSEICELNSYVSDSHYVINLVANAMMDGGTSDLLKNHWIVWEGQLKIKKDQSVVTLSTPLSEIVTLKLFSWGHVDDTSLKVDLTLEQFLKHNFGGMVFSKIP